MQPSDTEEGLENPVPTTRGNKRRKCPDEWMKTKKKKARNSKSAKGTPTIGCTHQNVEFCKAELLTEDEITSSYITIIIQTLGENKNTQNRPIVL
jgi:hypothetical protein